LNKIFESEKIVVFFSGGITYSEVCCLRALAKKTHKEFLITTSNMTNRKKFIESLLK